MNANTRKCLNGLSAVHRQQPIWDAFGWQRDARRIGASKPAASGDKGLTAVVLSVAPSLPTAQAATVTASAQPQIAIAA